MQRAYSVPVHAMESLDRAAADRIEAFLGAAVMRPKAVGADALQNASGPQLAHVPLRDPDMTGFSW